MSGNKHRFNRYHMDFLSGLLLVLMFCIIAVIFTMAKGCDVMFYAGFPMLCAAAGAGIGVFCADGFVAEQTAVSLKRGREDGPRSVLSAVLAVSLLWGAFVFVIMCVWAGELSKALFDFAKIAPVCRSYAPAIALMLPLCCLTGFLRGIGQKRYARMGIWMLTALFVLLSLVFGFYCAYRGVSVGSLLRNEDMSAIYCACGIGLGLDLAVGITFIVLAFQCRMLEGRLRAGHALQGRKSGERGKNADRGVLQRYFAERMFPALFAVVVLLLGIVVGYRLWLSGQTSAAIITSIWGGVMGIGLPVLAGSGVLSALPLTWLTDRALRDRAKGNTQACYTRISMVLRLSAYISVPWSVFCFGAANEIAALFPNLTVRGRMAAIMTIKYGCPLVFLVQTAVLMGYFFWNSRQERSLILAGAIAFFAQIIVLAVLRNLKLGIVMMALSLDIFFIVFLVTLYALGRQEVLKGLSTAWMIDDGLIAVCALIAVVPIEFLNDYLIALLPGYAAFLAAALLYAVVYVICSVLLQAADLRNVERIPGGGLVVSLAYMIGAAHAEDEE